MIDAAPGGNIDGLGYRFKDLDERIMRDEKAGGPIDPVDRWWLDA
jgi:hypothetical protein